MPPKALAAAESEDAAGVIVRGSDAARLIGQDNRTCLPIRAPRRRRHSFVVRAPSVLSDTDCPCTRSVTPFDSPIVSIHAPFLTIHLSIHPSFVAVHPPLMSAFHARGLRSDDESARGSRRPESVIRHIDYTSAGAGPGIERQHSGHE